MSGQYLIDVFTATCAIRVIMYTAGMIRVLIPAYKRHRDETQARRRIQWAADLLERSSE